MGRRTNSTTRRQFVDAITMTRPELTTWLDSNVFAARPAAVAPANQRGTGPARWNRQRGIDPAGGG
jgi:hypothetical protein